MRSTTPSKVYKGKTTPYSQQRAAFNKCKNFAYAGLFMEQGTGKTKVAIDRSAYLWEHDKIDGVIVLPPKSLTDTWVEEIATHCPDRVAPIVGVWDSSLTNKVIAEVEAVVFNDCKSNLPFLIVNIECIRIPRIQAMLHWWLKEKRIHAIVDESSRIKTISAKQSIAAHSVGDAATAQTVMTGTPTDGNAADYYSQLRFLMPAPIGYTNYYSFRAHYCVVKDVTIRCKEYYSKAEGKKVTTRKIKNVTGPKNEKELMAKLNSFSYFCKKKDCLDLPDKIYHKRFCSLTPEGLRIYKDVMKRVITEIEDDRFITIEIALARLLRLQQVIGGFLPSDDDPNATPIPGDNPRIQLLHETIGDFPGPTIIWARFKAEHLAIIEALKLHTTPDQIGEITGRVKKAQREEYRRAFQADKLTYLVCTQSCAGYGYTLTAPLADAETEIYYSNTFSHEQREQSEDRAHRIGQTKHVNIIDLICSVPGAKINVDLKLQEALTKKKHFAGILTDVRGVMVDAISELNNLGDME